MLRIDCPFCGMRDHSEFTYGEDASISYPPLESTDEQAWFEAIYLRDNPRGLHVEKWHHVQGCRQWLIVERDTLTHEIRAVKAAHPDAEALLKPSRKPTKAAKTGQKKTGQKETGQKKTGQKVSS